MNHDNRRIPVWAAAVLLLSVAAALPAQTPINPALPSIFIAGDSTAAEGIPNAIGWGKHFGAFFDTAKMNVVNRARGGRSSRTFITEGLWDALLAGANDGDYVLIQFGHNDGAARNGPRVARGSLPGLGEETEEIDNVVTKQHETVRTFGWYMRKMIADAKAKGATPILLSLTVRNIWTDGKVERGSGNYGQWTRELAVSEGVAFIDLTSIAAGRYEQMGEAAVKPLFPRDHTHTSEEGAELNARLVVSGIKALHENGIIRNFSAAGRAVEAAPNEATLAAKLAVPRGAPRPVFLHWLNLPDVGDPSLPSLFLIGDSTVRNGRGDGVDGQWGWGDALSAWFDPAKINLVNRAVGGTGARSFAASEYWDRVMELLKPGDVVIMQFGHNDNGRLAPLPGIGDEAEERENPRTNQRETYRTFGWYLKRYISEARSKGAIPVVCTLVPRNMWENGKIARPANSHADWARQVAKAEGVPLLDLHELIAQKYDPLGQEATTKLFADVRTHTNHAGAELSAQVVASLLRGMKNIPVAGAMRATPAPAW